LMVLIDALLARMEEPLVFRRLAGNGQP
jgi:hypothetical protein